MKTSYHLTRLTNVLLTVFGCSLATSVCSAPTVSPNGAFAGVRSNAAIISDPTRTNQKTLSTPSYRSKSAEEFKLPTVPKTTPINTGGTLLLKQVQFSGNTVFSNEELQELIQPYLNRALTGRDLEALRDSINSHYVNEGYINSGAMIPKQSVTNGVLQIQIIEGKLNEVRLEGMERLNDDYVKDRLKVGAGEPLNFKHLQQSYQYLLKDPLIERLNGTLVPGKQAGESVLNVKVTRARPYQLYADVDDYTTPVVGGYTGRIGGWVDNLTGYGERIDGSVAITGGSASFNTGIDIPLNAYDTRASFRYNNASSSLIESPIDKLNIKTKVISYDAGLSHPVYRDLEQELKVGVNFSVRQSYSSLDGQPFSFTEGLPANQGNTQATVLRLWQQYLYQGIDNAFVMRSTFNTGLNALGATIQNNDLLPSGEFFSWLGQAQYNHRVMNNGAQVVLKGAIQQAAAPLLPIERFSVGGIYSVRGFRESYFVRDNGFNVGIDFRYPIFGGEVGAEHSLFLIPFMDYGGAWNNPTLADLNPRKDYLHSIGLGFDWHYKNINAEFFWAGNISGVKPQGTTIQDQGVHFKVGVTAF